MDLEPAPLRPFSLAPDRRPLVPQPLPTRLVAVDDVHLPAAMQLSGNLDHFYETLLGFAREAHEAAIVYRAENFRLIFDVSSVPREREELRPLNIEVLSLRDTEQRLIDAEVAYERIRGLNAGADTLLVRDPAGNWVSISETREVR